MKKNILLIHICLIFSVFSIYPSQASDYITREKIDDIFNKEVNLPCSFRSMVLENISGCKQIMLDNLDKYSESAENKEDEARALSILHFIYQCQEAHFQLMDYSENEAELDFFQTEDYFQDYLGDHWGNEEQLKKCWSFYYSERANFFRKLENFTEAEKSLIKAGEIDAVGLRRKLGSLVAAGLNDWNIVVEQNIRNKLGIYVGSKHLILCQYATLYENVRRSQGLKEFDCIDNITLSILCLFGHDNEKGIEFGLKALGRSWPDRQDSLLRLQSSRETLKRAMAGAYYELKQFDKAGIFYSEVPSEDMTIECYKNTSCMYGFLELWEESFKYFKIFQEKSNNQTGFLFSVTEEEASSLMKMLMKQSTQDFNTYGKSFIQNLKKYMPHVEKDIELLMKYVREKKEADSRRIIRKAIAHQHLDSIQGIYQAFDLQYQNLWAHESLISSEASENQLGALNKIAQKIEDKYASLVSLKAKGSYADNISKILELSESLKKDITHFSSQVKEINHKISKMRRKLYKEYSQSGTTENEGFVEFNPSLKAQSLFELKQKESEAKNKEIIVTSKKQARKEKRVHLNQSYQEKMPKKAFEKENNNPSCTIQSSLISFKDKELQYLWEHKELSGTTLDILEALHKAKSIFQLRMFLNPGTKLEILTGDREGQISLRVNDQYRICFYWISGEGAYGVELVDYHR